MTEGRTDPELGEILIYEAAAAQSLDNVDMAGVTTLYEQWAGVKVRAKRDDKEAT